MKSFKFYNKQQNTASCNFLKLTQKSIKIATFFFQVFTLLTNSMPTENNVELIWSLTDILNIKVKIKQTQIPTWIDIEITWWQNYDKFYE